VILETLDPLNTDSLNIPKDALVILEVLLDKLGLKLPSEPAKTPSPETYHVTYSVASWSTGAGGYLLITPTEDAKILEVLLVDSAIS
jgi:hypothetical protein